MVANPAGDLAARVEAQLVADLLDVVLRRSFRYEQALGNLAIAQTVGDEAGYLALTSGEGTPEFKSSTIRRGTGLTAAIASPVREAPWRRLSHLMA